MTSRNLALRALLVEARVYVAEAPRDRYGDSYPECIDVELLSRIDAAINQPEAKPVAWMKQTMASSDWDEFSFSVNQMPGFDVPLFT